MNEKTAPTDLDMGSIPAYQERQFVPDGADFLDTEQVEALFRRLVERRIENAEELERLLSDWSELSAICNQVQSILYIRMTTQTDDPQRAELFQRFVKEIQPVIHQWQDRFQRQYLECRKRISLDADRYLVFDRDAKADVELFREENVPLKTEEELLSQKYQTICGAMTVDFDGNEYTMPQMKEFLRQPDRTLREKAWRTIADRYLQDTTTLDEVFDEMLRLRVQIARNAGFDNYRDYKFREYHRFDYTHSDCMAYHEAVLSHVVPLYETILAKRSADMGIEPLRPWDVDTDPLGREALKPFKQIPQYINGIHQMFARVDDELAEQFQQMNEQGLLDLASRKGKAPGGYQATLTEARRPFIFANAVGSDADLRTLLHEAGHAFHVFACQQEPLVTYRHAPIEFCEVASMSMELLAGGHLDVFYNPEEGKRSRRAYFELMITMLTWIAMIDAFQDWIYMNPDHDVEQRRRAWLEIHNRFGSSLVDWSGLDVQRQSLWHRQLHVFEVPFYYIEYAIAQLGALQIWLQAKEDPHKALQYYKQALALGGSRPLHELFSAAGIDFGFSARTVAPLVEAVKKELLELWTD